jgi:hypothetical protein
MFLTRRNGQSSFKKEAERKFKPNVWGKTIIHIEGDKPKAVSTGRLIIEAVTPAQQTVEQAKSELLRKETTKVRKQRSSGKRKLSSVTEANLKQKHKGSKIYNRPRQISANKQVATWDRSGF